MSPSAQHADALTQAFAARRRPAASHECPDPAQLFEAASGTLPRELRLQVVDHVARCAHCSEDWRIAMELGARPAGDAGEPRRAGAPATLRLALAAGVVAAVATTLYLALSSSEQPVQYRDAANALAPLSLTEQSLPRERFLLRWSAGPPGSSYTVQLARATLAPLHVEQRLASPEFLVPAAALEGVASGERLLWQVEMQLPDGEQVASETYVVTLR